MCPARGTIDWAKEKKRFTFTIHAVLPLPIFKTQNKNFMKTIFW